MKKKDQFLIEALRLFAEKGYDAVSVAEIATAVGCSAPALYKHYPSKQALFDALVETSKKGFSEQMSKLRVDFLASPDERKGFVAMSEEEQIEVMKKTFLRILEDEYPSLFRKLMTVEQFHRPELALQYNKRYMDSQYDASEALMQEFMDAGVMKKGNARMMGMQYAAPIIMYIYACDREPERREEALQAIEEHIRQFNRAYREGGDTYVAGTKE